MIQTSSPTHWKFRKCAELCKISLVEAFGYWTRLMCYVGQHHADGDLTMLTDDDINGAVGYVPKCQDAMTFSAALRTDMVKILTVKRSGKVIINSWDEYNGRYWHRLEQDRKRKVFHGKSRENPRKTSGKSDVPYPTGSSSYEEEHVPYQKIMETWNQMASNAGLPRLVSMTESRRKVLRARWSDSFWRENWAAALAAIPSRSFLLGTNGRGWKANFDFFTRPDSVAKIIEGQYAGSAGDGLSKRPKDVLIWDQGTRSVQ